MTYSVFLEQTLGAGLVSADIVARHQAQSVHHPVVDIVGIGEELVEIDRLIQPLLTETCQVYQVVPLVVDLAQTRCSQQITRLRQNSASSASRLP